MFPSQASYTFNPLLPFTPSVSIPYLPFDALAPFAGTPILQSVADFISSSHSSSAETVFKLAPTTTQLPQRDSSNGDDRTATQNSFDFLEDTVSRLFGDYRRLYATMKNIQPRYSETYTGRLDFLQKASLFVEINEFKRRVKNMLCRLATLTLEYPQESLVNHTHMVYSALASSDSFKDILQGHQSLNIFELLTMFFNTPIILENSLYLNYINNKSSETEEEQEKITNLVNTRCPTAKSLVCETSSSLIEIIGTKKMISCSEEDIEEESERHERSSTTSASSRTNPGEVDLPHNYTVFGGASPQSNKTTSASKEKDVVGTSSVHEIYDGCFFGDLTVSFSPTDKLMFEVEENNEKEVNGHHNNTWKKNYNNNFNKNIHKPHNFPMTPVFTPNQHTFPNFNQRIEEPSWKPNPVPTVDPSLLKTPPTSEQKIIPLNLFTLPQGTLLPTNAFNLFNPGNVIMPGPVQQMSTPPSFNNRRIPGTAETVKPVQNEKSLSEQKPSDRPLEVKPSLQSDKKQVKPHNAGPVAVGKASNPTSAPKISHTQASKNGNAGKKNGKKKPEKGGIKLWDMINVQGKLKNF